MDFEVYSVGIVCASLCTSLPIDQATERLNAEIPTGLSSKWTLSEDKTFASGQLNGCDCPDHSGNKHYLFNC
jgi:hypothetical protein